MLLNPVYNFIEENEDNMVAWNGNPYLYSGKAIT